jgi:hypothetical protein
MLIKFIVIGSSMKAGENLLRIIITLSLFLFIFLLGSGCTGPKLRLEPKAKTIQEQCGVLRDQGVSKEQAICIAMRAGLEEGTVVWSVKEDRYRKSGEIVWIIKNTLERAGQGKEPHGISITISKKDGRILAIGRWERVRTEQKKREK